MSELTDADVGLAPAELSDADVGLAPAAPADSLGRRFGMGVGGVISGAIDTLRNPAAAIGNIPSVVANTIAGRQVVPEPFRYNVGREIADNAGLPRPVTPTERIVDSAVQGGAGMIGPMGLARGVQAAAGVAAEQAPRTVGQAVTGAFANNPGTDLAAGAVGGAVGGAIEQAGGGVVGQVAGEVAGNVITAAIIAAVARRRGLMPESVRPESITPEEIAGVSPEVADAYRAAGMSDAEIRQTLDAFTLANAQRERAAPGVRDPQPGAAPDPAEATPRMAQDFQERAASPRDPEMPRTADAPVVREPPQTFRYTQPDPNVEFPGATTGPAGERPQTAMGRTPFPDQGEIIPPARMAPSGEPPPRGPIIDGEPPAGRAIDPEVQRIEAQIGRLTRAGEPDPGTPAGQQVARLRQTLRQIGGPRAPETPQGQGTQVRAAPREVGGAEGTPLPPAGGAAQEVGAPPRVSLADRAANRAAEREARFLPQRTREAEAAAAAARQRAEEAAARYDREAATGFQYTGTGPNRAALTRARDTTAAALRDAEAAVAALRARADELAARITPQQGAPDAAPAQAPMARPQEAPVGNVSPEAPRVGTAWDSPGGRRVIEREDNGQFWVRTGDERSIERMDAALVNRMREVDTANVRSRAEASERQARQDAAAAEAKRAREDLDGFDSGMTPLARSKIVAALTQQVNYRGRAISRRDLVRQKVEGGATVTRDSQGNRILESPDGAFLDQRAITKTGLDYAEHLTRRRAAVEARRRAVYDPEAPEQRGAANAEEGQGRQGPRVLDPDGGPAPRDSVAGSDGARPDAAEPPPARGGEPADGPAAGRSAPESPDGVAPREGGTPLYANPLADPAAWRRFLADPITGTIQSLRGRLRTSVASIGTTPGVGAAWRLYADSARATLLHFQERYASVPGMRDLVENLGGTDPGSGRRVAGGYQETADATARSLNNRVAAILRPIGDDAASLGRVRDILTGTTPRGATPAERAAAQRLRTLLDEHHAWLSKRLGSAEKELGYVRGRYFPRRFDTEAIQADLSGFTADATALYRRMGLDAGQARMAADEWANRVMGIGGGARYADTPASAYTKGRTLPPDADTLMRKWLVTDPREALAGYLDGSTRHAEFVTRFGPNGQKFDEVLKGMREAGATPTEIDILRRAFASATGTVAAGQNPTTGLLSWSQMWGMRQLLTRALFSSAMEPISVGLRSGNLADSFRALGDTWRRFLTPDSWQGDRARMEAERAELLGVVGDSTREMLMAARVESQNLRTRDATRINQMLTITGQNRLFAASRIAASRIAEHTVAKLAGDTSPGARRALAELGMNEADAAAVSAWLRRHDGKPPVAELTGDTPAANAYRTAVNRFVNESVVNPLAVDRPTGAGERHPMAQLGYSIMSFQYAFTRNVLIRAIKSGDAALRGGSGLGATDRMALLVPMAGLAVLAAAQMGMSNVRDAIFNRQAKQERPPMVSTVLAMDRAGLFGNLSPLVNLVTSAKYERDASGALVGAYIGNMLRQAGDIGLGTIPQDMGGPNSPNTNNAEWAATRSAWGLVAAPAMVGVLASAPIPAWAKPAAGAAAMYVGSSDMSRTVATTVAGPRDVQARTPGGAAGSRQPTRSARTADRQPSR